jgi:hypothetical protein
MRALAWAAVVGASVVVCGAASSACPPKNSTTYKVSAAQKNASSCTVDLNLAPEASQQIVAGENIPLPPAKGPPVVPIPAYDGPVIGAAPNMGRAPEIGFRWETN